MLLSRVDNISNLIHDCLPWEVFIDINLLCIGRIMLRKPVLSQCVVRQVHVGNDRALVIQR